MLDRPTQSISIDNSIEQIRQELANDQSSKWRRITEKFALAALSAIPWVGGFVAAAAQIRSDEAAVKGDDLRTKWLEEHRKKLEQLNLSLGEIHGRFQSIGLEIEERIQSPEYLALVRQAFRTWDSAETEDKRQFVANLISNAAGPRVCSDDVVRLFISWLDLYHEAHFAIIREVHQNPGSTRFDIWSTIYGRLPQENSAEADLYKMLIRDLSTGGVIRQARDTNELGQFVRRRPQQHRGPTPSTLESAFEDNKPYALTELGKQFVHYTLMSDVRRLGRG